MMHGQKNIKYGLKLVSLVNSHNSRARVCKFILVLSTCSSYNTVVVVIQRQSKSEDNEA